LKHTIVMKFVAILLAACALVAAEAGAVGIVVLSQMGLYTTSYDDWKQETTEVRARNLADNVLERYAAHTFSDLPKDKLAEIFPYYTDGEDHFSYWSDVTPGTWYYAILDDKGTILEDSKAVWAAQTLEFRITAQYPMLVTENVIYRQNSPAEPTDPWSPTMATEQTVYVNWDYTFRDDTGNQIYAATVTGDTFTVKIAVTNDFLADYGGITIELMELLFHLRYSAIAILGFSLLLFAVCMVYLCCAAGRTVPGAPVEPGGLNRAPLDLYLAVAVGGCLFLVWLAFMIMGNWFYSGSNYNVAVMVLSACVLLVAAVIGVGFCFAVAAQCKMRNFFWWRHSIIGWCLGKLWAGIRFVFKGLCKLFRLLPVIWKYLLIGAAMGLVPLFFLMLAWDEEFFILPWLMSLLADLVILCYGGYAYGTLLKGAKRMAQGTLHTKIPTKYLLGSYKTCAEHLNALADVATVAAKNQLKSERMKTELITNVSHDIKTPLTSIINYVDLLEKPHSSEEGEQYLEVLGRQSQRLKKLIEDLMEMSKATTGNMAVEITQVDAAEAVNQALGEFADKLEAAHLNPVFRQPERQVVMQADGRLTWRVLSNLLSNIVKYALPGTRVYIDLVQLEHQVLISLKNISREALNVSADELTERFVRGDAARNTEGSGLGLNIAKSLMELQKGQLQLLVDGDLFKVTLVFPTN